MRLVLAVALVVATFGTQAGAEWVRVASSPDEQVFVDAGSLAKDSRGFISVWTKTLYTVPQTAVGIQYAADMTRFVLDCADARYGVVGGKFLDVHGNVLRQFDEPAGELQPIPVATKIDAVAKAICSAGGHASRGK
ncbi:surface-adhesin E family protein [Paraburkholderia sp. WC7.3g]|uniref:surface-adhesin E family protein n=1 Tax=Paraburkholderia sp. WC7.3g TaxID=2991070 RepID=UPI003D1E9359